MYIPLIYILFVAEALLILFFLNILLGILAYKLSQYRIKPRLDVDIDRSIHFGSSYIELLEKELMKNSARIQVEKNIEHDTNPEHATKDTQEKHSKLLQLRDLFLQVEKGAAEKADNDIHFWEHIHSGIDKLLEHFHKTRYESTTLPDADTESKTHHPEAAEKVFYIETQGKKIDGEVNRLKDIIFDQENTMSDLIKALKKAEAEHGENDGEGLEELRTQMDNLERQLRDSKMCMEVLEMENSRLQEQIQNAEFNLTEKILDDIDANTDSITDTNADNNMVNLRETIDKQEQHISELTQTLVELETSSEQTERLKSMVNDFTRNSKEMMNCIAILEEENERLKSSSSDPAPQIEASNSEELQTKIKKLEGELIKKDMAYARLQDEFASIEKEYLSMYNAIHGNNG